ncbi:transglutaminase domain-containing protein [Gluconacetobacter azotocaptans]|uniref:Transglutaminase domain-containing protein n=2 Tax=Gluconacetobacter azotocaptans TaxID=142834 RepID=A0A7W4PCF1_9PROT|nr:transglutaminase-like domain-containing protein [Gluconacetobacter azotocaptans]MBB2188580.1 transglutaminase domain-containing protein [Gluconacetobacter azotocaptans]MBM9400285.1 transglutaminase domain-containing protein [Gluconacetobacter azotocaptans]GBQ28193.1 hypothetical protein AA13594_0900 [Gluconacetobacter azotocaptans DSM 13594]
MTTILKFDDRYRTVDEERMLDSLLLLGWAFCNDIDGARIIAREALDRWIASGLGVRLDPAGRRFFDPVEVVHSLKHAGTIGDDDFWQNHYVTTSRRLIGDLAARADEPVTVTLRRTYNFRNAAPGKARRLRLGLPLRHRCDFLDIRAQIPDQGATCVLSDGRLDVQVSPSAAEEISIGADICFRPRSGLDAPDPPDVDLYLRPDEGLIKLTPPIAALARRLGGSAAPKVAVRAFWDFMIDEFLSGPVHYDQLRLDAPLDWVLEARCCDCQLGSAFFVALCRARGIPARLVSGYFLFQRSPTLHYWSEVWLDDQGWASFDFMSWDLSKGGRDPAWRDHFFGRVDARMVTQCLPRLFTGSVGVAIPPTWRILQTSRGDGVDISLIGADSAPIYSDYVAVH